MLEKNTIYHQEYTKVLQDIPNQSIDFILTKIPTTIKNNQAKLNINIKEFWHNCLRIIKPNGVIAISAIQPFTSLVICSQISLFRYCWYWQHNVSPMLTLPERPHADIEEIAIFYKEQPLFYAPMIPQLSLDKFRRKTINPQRQTYHTQLIQLKHNIVQNNLYQKQLSVDVATYLIKIYTKPHGTVLDPFAQMGAVGNACINTQRDYILIEENKKLVDVIHHRLTFSAIQTG